MKAYIYFLSLLLTFAPVYANAILPALTAVASSKAGKVVLTKAGGAVLRTLSPTSITGLAKTAVGICAKNPLAFAFCTTVISAIKGDGLDITVINNETNDVDVEISRRTQDKCTEYCDPNYQFCFASPEVLGRHYFNLDAERLKKEGTILSSYQYKNYSNLIVYFSYTERDDVVGSTESTLNTSHFVRERKTDCSNTVLSDSEINQYFNKYVSDDDITNIYNYDYSQHTTIKVNSDIDTGDNINNKIKNSNSENDKEMTETAAQKSKDKNSDYHPDKINDENCSKDDMGRYDKCGADRDDDDTASTPASTPTPTDTPTDDDEPPIECNSNGFYKKVCDWMDWTQEEPTKPTDDKPPIKDIDAEDAQKIDMDGSCPAPYELNFSIFGYQQNNSISYQPLCNALEMLKPVFVGAGALSSMFILLGYSRQSGAGGNQ
jgi:hypothetical protein